jgi:hypothetical protein
MKTGQCSASMLVALATLVVGLAPFVQGQTEAGARVRVTTNAQKKVVGTLMTADADSVRLISSKHRRVVSVPTASIVRLEKSGGRRSNFGGGALIGGLVGGGVGLLLGVLASTDNSGWWEVGGEEVAAGTAVLGLAGAGLGTIIGGVSHKDKWEQLPRPGTSAVYLGSDSVPREADALPAVR